ncbi:SAM-dependent methyltransferase [Halobacteriovorax sp.]|uniref:SAM-dependent methyltransferase n=1 Tax=Halobacteriovorax sp. TaxID=2020862 RepID=UPI00356B389E
MHYILAKNVDWLGPLKEEIKNSFDTESESVAGLPILKVSSDLDLKNKYLAFSTTALLNTEKFPEDSISKQAQALVDSICKKISADQSINLHVFSMTNKYGVLETGRAEILKDKIHKNLRKNKIRILRKKFDRSLAIVQVMLLDDRSVILSVQTSEEVSQYNSLYSPYVGGFNNVEDDKKAPSRAFKKIVEAQEILGVKISENETLIDLGACPGGWTYIARKNGASVIAIDRSELREDLMVDEKVQFLQTDAFKYRPDQTLDWSVSDIISTPDRVIELITTWVLGKLCRNFIFTIKFQGKEGYHVLEDFKKLADQCDFKIILKQLNANKNEVTIMGTERV